VSDLPRIHAKLIPLLEEYEETYGEPFLWNGIAVGQEIVEMHRKEEESMTRSQGSIGKKKSQSGLGLPRPQNWLTQRAPFQLQEFMI
jgi:hypothetical protein